MITPRDLMLLTAATEPFNRPGWVFELKQDGFRILAAHHATRAALLSRRIKDYGRLFPEIAAELLVLPDVVIDGELVMLDDAGRPHLDRLTRRCRLQRPSSIDHAARIEPAVLFAFDLLELEGRDLRELPLLERKAHLEEVLDRSKRIRCTEHQEDGLALFSAAEQAGAEGIVGKRADSPYRQGRSDDWVKIKTAAGRVADEERAKWNDRRGG